MDKSSLETVILETVRLVPKVKEHLSPQARTFLARKADSTSENRAYHDAITQSLIDYFEGGSIAPSRNSFKQAMIEAFGNTFDAGWTDAGAELPVDEDALDWLGARMNEEAGFIDMLFQQARQLRNEEGFDYFTWINGHADAYTRTLREIYNTARLWIQRDKMVTFSGTDGEESCVDCKRLKGLRRRISWFIARDAVPPHGRGLECHPGRRCQHYLADDAGEQVTF